MVSALSLSEETKKVRISGRLAQLVEHLVYTERVGSSSLSSPTKSEIHRSLYCGGVAQLVRAPACHAGGRGFESRHSRHLLMVSK
jgi:hypothetical protein